jgi:SdrD B-like domain/FG-GAP-like repeat/RTX calcium-binding nonapeptide repeat (4 copies)
MHQRRTSSRRPKFPSLRPRLERLEARITPSSSVTVDGLYFLADSTFTSSNQNGTTVDAVTGGSVQIGYAPTSGASFLALLNVNLNASDGTLQITEDGASYPVSFTYGTLQVISQSGDTTVWQPNSSTKTFSTSIAQLTTAQGALFPSAGTDFTLADFPFTPAAVALANPGTSTAQSQSQLQGLITFDAELGSAATLLPQVIVDATNPVVVDPTGSITLPAVNFSLTAPSNSTIGGLSLGNAGLGATYTQNTGTWTISGNATLGTQAQDTPSETAFTGVSVNNTTITLVNGAFSEVVFDFSVNFTLFGADIQTLANAAPVLSYDFAQNQFEMSGGFDVAFDGNTVMVTLGYGPGNDAPGLVIEDGVVTTVNAVVATDINLFGASFQTTGSGLTLQYDRTNEQFTIFGTMELQVGGATLFTVTLGTDAADAGLLLQNGNLLQIDTVITSSQFRVGPVTWQVQNAGFNWIEDNGNDVFIIFGDFNFQEVFSLDVQLGSDPGVTDTNSGLIVDNGNVEINNFTVTLQNANVGFLTIKELTVTYSLDASTGDYNLDLDGSAYFPETGTAVTTTFDFNTTTDAVDEFSMSVDLGGDQQIALGTTGLFVVAASIQVDNPSSIDNMQITGSVALVYGTQIGLAEASAYIMAGNGTVTITKDEFLLSGTVYLGASPTGNTDSNGLPEYTSLIGNGTGSMALDWGDQNYQASFSASLFDGTYKVSADFEFGGTGQNTYLYIKASATVGWPKVVPFIGGTTLASATFVFDYQGEDPATQEPIGYVAAWIDVDYLVGHSNVGFLIDIDDTQVSDPQLIGNHTINQISAGTYEPKGSTVYTYSEVFTVPAGANVADFSVQWPQQEGSQTVAFEMGQGSQGTVVYQDDYESSTNPSATLLASPSGPYAMTTLITEISGSSLPGTYTYYLFSSEQFNTDELTWQMTYAIPDPTVSVSLPATSNPDTSAGVDVSVNYAVGSGLASQTTVTVFADTDNQGYDGFKIGSFTPTADSGTQSVTWTLTDLPYATYYVYASVEDEINETTYSVYASQTVAPTGPISGKVMDSVNGGGVEGVQVFLDSNNNGVYDPSNEPVWTTNSAGYYRFDYEDAAQTTPLSAGSSYSVGLIPVDGVTVVPTGTPVSLTYDFNLTGIYADGSTFSSTGGLDSNGNAYSASQLGTSLTWEGVPFDFGTPGANDVVTAGGQTIDLTQTQSSSLLLLATAVNGSQPDQEFTVTYTDGSTQSASLSLSDWTDPQSYTGESVVLAMPYCDVSNGSQLYQTVNLYGYSLALDSTKTVQSITLPDNESVKLLAITEVISPTNPQATLCPTTLGQATTFYATVSTSISGTVYNDNNMDGVYDSGDTGAEGWIVYVDLNDSGQFEATDPSATTDATGAYRIFDLSPNTTYSVRLYQNPTTQANYFNTSPLLQTVTTNSDTTELISNINYGVLQYATITGTVNFTAANGSTTVPQNWVLNLLDSNNNIVQTTTVNANNGSYSFTNLVPGSYTIEQVVQSEWLQTSPITATYNWVGEQFDIPVTPIAMTYGDFNNDGYNDLAVLSDNNSNTATITLYLNQDDGTFQQVNVLDETTGATASSLSFNASDDSYDLLTLTGIPNAQGPSLGIVTKSGKLYVVRNDTTDTDQVELYVFTSAWAGIGDVHNIWGYGSGDLNNDGITDLVQSYTGNNSDNQLDTFLTSATGGSIAQTEDFANVGSLALGDLNLDGNLDVVWFAEHGNDNNDFQVFYGNGDGTLTTPQQYSLNTGGSGRTPAGSSLSGPTPIATGDFSGDGLLDLVTTYSVGGKYGILLWYQNSNDGFYEDVPSSWISGMSFSTAPFGVSVQNFLGASFSNLSWVVYDSSTGSYEVDILGDGYGDFSQEPESGSTLQMLGINETPVSVSYFDALDNGLPSIAIAQTTEGGSEVQVYRNEANRAVNLPVTAFSGTNQGGVFYNAQYSTESGTVTSDSNLTAAQGAAQPALAVTSVSLDSSDSGKLATQAGTVYSDNDLNGIWDAGEQELPGITVFLDANGNGTLDPGEQSAVTNAQGFYLFSNVQDGQYTVTVQLPQGYLSKDKNAISQRIVVRNGQVADPADRSLTFGIKKGIDIVEYSASTGPGNRWTMVRHNAYLDLMDDQTGGVLERQLLDQVYSASIYLSNFAADTLTIDLRSGGSFSVPGQIDLNGGRDGAGGYSTFILLCGFGSNVVQVSTDEVIVNGSLTITWTNLRAEFLDGGPGNNSLAVSGGNGDDVFTIGPALIGAAGMQIGYTGFDSVSVDGEMGANTVILQGTAGADALAVNTDSVSVNGQVIGISYISRVLVLPGAGNDVVGLFADGTLQNPGTARELSVITVIDPGGNDTYDFDIRRMAIDLSDSSGIDMLDFSRMPAGVTIRLAASGPQQITPGLSGVRLTLTGIFENVTGSAFSDRIIGNSVANVIHGGRGADIIQGLGGNDILYGDAGNDVLFGDRGNDTILGGRGNDILVGGPGKNRLYGQGGHNIIIHGSKNHPFRARIGHSTSRFRTGKQLSGHQKTQHDRHSRDRQKSLSLRRRISIPLGTMTATRQN